MEKMLRKRISYENHETTMKKKTNNNRGKNWESKLTNTKETKKLSLTAFMLASV